MKTDARPFPLRRYEAADDAMREEAERIKAEIRATHTERAIKLFLQTVADARRRKMQGDYDDERNEDWTR